MQKSETASDMYNPIIRLLPVQTPELSEKAKMLKDAFAQFSLSCDEIRKTSKTVCISDKNDLGNLASSVCALFILSSVEVYSELFGEYPTRTQ